MSTPNRDEAGPDRDATASGRPSAGGGPASGADPARNGGPRPDEASGGGGTSRRDFLKVLGLSGAGAATAACSPPETTDRLLPYLVDPADEGLPGENTVYATVLAGGGPEPLGLHAWVREGKLVQIEGNPEFPTNGTRTSALARSALQDLHDPDRIRGPRRRSGGGFQGAPWESGLTALGQALSGGGVVLLTDARPGTRDRFYDAWAEAVGARHVRWQPLHHAAERAAHEIVFGRREIPAYRLERADRIVSFGADFLGTWLAPVELAGAWAESRRIEDGRHAELTFAGPRASLTGTNADEWVPVRAGQAGPLALAVARSVAEARGGSAVGEAAGILVDWTPERVAERTGVPAERIRRLGREIAAAERPVALPPGPESHGTGATDAHVAVALLNQVAGAVGTTLEFGAGPLRSEAAGVTEIRELVEQMSAGQVSTLVVAGPNPVFSLPPALGFREALEGVETVVSLGSHPDETAMAADWILPTHHELESWGDVEVRPGVWGLGQPVLSPLFDTRAREDVLLQAAEAGGLEIDLGAPDFATYLQNAWRERWQAADSPGGSFGAWWRAALQRGGDWSGAAEPAADLELASGLAEHAFVFDEPGGDGDFDLVVYPSVQFYDGRGANRSWMQELPDPVTKVVWGSWVEMHPETAAPLGLETGDLVEVSSPAGSVSAPVYLYEGIRPDAVAVPVGQGHTAYGRNARDRGVNPLNLLEGGEDARSGAPALAGTRVRVRATGEAGDLVVAQGSDSDLDREIAEMMEIGEARSAVEAHEVDLTQLVEAAWDSDPRSPYRWGMTIDLNACTGCSACVTACYSENNVPVVGEERCAEGREMSWLRIERYFEETADGGFQVAHVPMLCQHCGDAPCEPVCPVYATYHNPEGLNVQVYNRCVGTRYCSNNCPYKVRRFNWFSYDFPYPLNLQLNPDVTVRDKGVMEKCSFCVQRINRAKVEAKEEGRLVGDGEVVTACQSACPTEAISFGNLKDPTSRVSRIARGARSYHVLGELNTRPAVTYLQDVTHAEMAHADEHGGSGAEEGHAAASGIGETEGASRASGASDGTAETAAGAEHD